VQGNTKHQVCKHYLSVSILLVAPLKTRIIGQAVITACRGWLLRVRKNLCQAFRIM